MDRIYKIDWEMTNRARKIRMLSPEEDAEINRQIAEDPDTFELDEEWFRQAKPSAEIIPHMLEKYHQEQEDLKSGRKERLRILLDKEVLDYFRGIGGDWHSRINQTLRQVMEKDKGSTGK